MAGTIQTLVSKRLFEFSKPAAATSQMQEMILVKALPCHMWRQAVLLLRYHSAPTAWISGQQTDAVARMEAYCDEDPTTDFVWSTDLAVASLLSTTQAPRLKPAVVNLYGTPGTFGGFLRIFLRATQPAGTPGTVQ